jgi:DNA polymerase-3 subunit gamma/tau
MVPGASSVPAGQATGPPGGSRADFESVSQRWPEILEAVKRERRVAWMLLSNAAVHSVEDGVLTVRFAREGDVKGFSGSGCDRDLGRVLATAFGFKLQVRAIYAAQLGSVHAGPPPAGSAQHPPVPSASPPARPGQSDSVRSDQSDLVRSEAARSAAVLPDQARPGPVRPDRAQSDAVRSDQAPAKRAPAAPEASRADLTGMDLIKRELGAKIIAEIDEA